VSALGNGVKGGKWYSLIDKRSYGASGEGMAPSSLQSNR